MHLLRSLFLILLIAQGAIPAPAIAASLPEDVRRLAVAYVKAHPEEKAPRGSSLSDEYARGFLQGFLYPEGSLERPGIYWAAYAQGQARWREGPEAQERTFAGYGYARVELTGSWLSGFETSFFQPDGHDRGYWLSFLPGVKLDLPWSPGFPARDRRRVRVVGYLSPEGSYGHLGMYVRELYARSVEILEVPTSATPPSN